MSEVLVLVDIVDGQLRPVNAEMLAFAARLGTPAAVVVGAPGTAAAHREQLAGWGAQTVYAAESDDAPHYLITPQVTALATVAASVQPAAVLLPLTVDGRETAGRLAVRLDGALLSDVVDLAADGTVTHSVYGGSYTVHARAAAGIPVITIRPNSLPDPQATPGAGTLTEVPLTFDTATATRILQTETEPVGDRPDLAAASVVVSGGRGVGSAENFAVVEDLADALGGAVGASRAAVDSGYYPHQFQVGQTGTSVAPQLYIGLGISGAIQHRAGMQTSKTIIAVNKDADAPIFEITDLGIVGDLFTVAPQLAEAVKARKS
ncbi:electron transfer flavoprotein subunit alpha/FixB family protein [Nakamurella deserti]|uniref:electron transfer flavoprotein subunit alpha/FixB family protein n=1 Tax=Nakamurella deserti TaxID=2164074 RepID=UPI000DBE85AE|nr:electron transfer flavoprotein subunit alpha/FixB family protein [Nakamurella deserti]